MKIAGKTADFCGTKKKRGKKEERISMGKKANAFFFSGSPFLFFSFFPHDFHRKRSGTPRSFYCLAFPSLDLISSSPSFFSHDFHRKSEQTFLFDV